MLVAPFIILFVGVKLSLRWLFLIIPHRSCSSFGVLLSTCRSGENFLRRSVAVCSLASIYSSLAMIRSGASTKFGRGFGADARGSRFTTIPNYNNDRRKRD